MRRTYLPGAPETPPTGYAAAMIPTPAHPSLHSAAFTARFPAVLGTIPSPTSLTNMLQLGVPTPFSPVDDPLRLAVRDMLRVGGFKPTGRSKPASEYLVKAAEGGFLGSINAVVDACNVVSLHSGFPISVVDRARTRGALRIDIAGEGAEYIFNASGQTIDIAGLVCLCDDEGPCANAVKDAQRTKTTPETTDVAIVVWGVVGYAARVASAACWYRELLSSLGAVIEEA